jgi:glutathionylspermidine synthase
MTQPYTLGAPLESAVWRTVRERAIFECCKWDIQTEDHCTLFERPLMLRRAAWDELRKTAEMLAAEVTSAEAELLQRPDLHRELGLPRALRNVLAAANHPTASFCRILRFDFHHTDEGWKISEVNADVPGGFIEASGFTMLMAEQYPGCEPTSDPVAAIVACYLDKTDAVVVLLHATAYKDDRQVMQYFARRLKARHVRTLMASPAHLQWSEGRASIDSESVHGEVDAIFRFFPAEWLPRIGTQERWLALVVNGRTPTSNPASAALIQSKRFPLIWSRMRTSMEQWQQRMPESAAVTRARLHDREWVIKPAFGRVGEGIAISGVTTPTDISKIHRAATWFPRHWVAQRRFRSMPLAEDGCEYFPSLGVYTVNGRAAGVYARMARKPLIDHDARDVAVLISKEDGR